METAQSGTLKLIATVAQNIVNNNYATLEMYAPVSGVGPTCIVTQLNPDNTPGNVLAGWNGNGVQGGVTPAVNLTGALFDEEITCFDVSGISQIQITSSAGGEVLWQLSSTKLTVPSSSGGGGGGNVTIISPVTATPGASGAADPAAAVLTAGLNMGWDLTSTDWKAIGAIKAGNNPAGTEEYLSTQIGAIDSRFGMKPLGAITAFDNPAGTEVTLCVNLWARESVAGDGNQPLECDVTNHNALFVETVPGSQVTQTWAKPLNDVIQFPVQATGDTALAASPGVTSNYKILGYEVFLTGDATTAGGGEITWQLEDTNGNVWAQGNFYAPAVAANVLGGVVVSRIEQLPNGGFQCDIDAGLQCSLSAALATGIFQVQVWVEILP